MKPNIIFIILIIICCSHTFAQNEFPSKDYSLKPHERITGSIKSPMETVTYFNETMLDSFIVAILSRYSIPGLTACILKDGETVWHNNYGYANIAQNLQVNDSTTFVICGISESIVATAVMQLWEQGLFQLEDDINNYLPRELEVHNSYNPQDPITFEMLLTNTSSIKDNNDFPFFYPGDPLVSLDSFLINYLMPGGLYFDSLHNFYNLHPGQTCIKSNVGIALLGYLVESISGLSFEEYCQLKIFEPLNMNNTSWFLTGLDNSNIAMPYVGYTSNPVPLGHLSNVAYPAENLRTSVLQLSNFLSAYMQHGPFARNTIFKDTTIQMMLTRRVFAPFNSGFWGLGWCHSNGSLNSFGPWLWGLYDQRIGATAQMFFSPAENYGYIVFFNIWLLDQTPVGEVLSSFAFLWDKIYAYKTNLLPKPNYIRPFTDSLQVTTHFVNHNNYPFNSHAIFFSLDSSYQDSVPLFDDGMHGDGGSDDGVWGNNFDPVPSEDYFNVKILSNNMKTGERFITEEDHLITSVGPLVFHSYQVHKVLRLTNGYRAYVKMSVRNTGLRAAARDVEVEILTEDKTVLNIVNARQRFGEIAAGGVGESPNTCYIITNSNSLIDTINFKINIYSYGTLCWQDSTVSMIVGLENSERAIPKEFTLHQNYPNPFNPTTTIEFSLPKASNVTLKIFNILGEELAMLVSDRLAAGTYQYEWDASNLASGVYLYRLQASDFVETKKMVLMR